MVNFIINFFQLVNKNSMNDTIFEETKPPMVGFMVYFVIQLGLDSSIDIASEDCVKLDRSYASWFG